MSCYSTKEKSRSEKVWLRTSAATFMMAVLSGMIGSSGLAQGPSGPPPNCGTNFDIKPPPSGSMVQVSNQGNESGDDNIVWSHSGNYLAVDRSDPTANTPSGNKYVFIINLTDLGNIQGEGARSSAASTPLLPNITDFTWNDDRVLFGNIVPGSKSRLLSCTAFGATNISEFLKDPSGSLHVFSPSTIFDPVVNKERLLFLTSTATGEPQSDGNPATRVNVWTVTYDAGGVPNWNDKQPLTSITTTNTQIESVKWCTELGSDYQPLVDRYALVTRKNVGGGQTNPPPLQMKQVDPPSPNQKVISVFTGARAVLSGSNTVPTDLSDSRFSIRDPEVSAGSQVSWTYNGVYVMYSKAVMMTNPPFAPKPGPIQESAELYSTRSAGASTPTIFQTPSEFNGSNKQWLCISPDGMRAAFTVNKKVYVMPMQFDNMAIAGTSNLLSDGGYTLVSIPGGALDSNCTFNILSPNGVDTNDPSATIINGTARMFAVNGVTNQQFNFNTNVELSLRFSTNNLPTDVTETNLAIFTYNPTNVEHGHTGTWEQIASIPDTTNKFVTSTNITHFSIYAIGVLRSSPAVTIAAADFDGDGLADPAVYEAGNWHVWLSLNGYARLDVTTLTGATGTPVAADFDGDGLADPAVYEAGTWHVWLSLNGYARLDVTTLTGATGAPVAADFDGDGLADPAVYEAGNWHVWLSLNGYARLDVTTLTGATGTPVAGDFDGDGLADPTAVDTSGTWYVWLSASGYGRVSGSFAVSGGTPAASDFDGDRKADPAMVDISGNWYVWFSGSSYAQGGPYSLQVP